MNCYRNLAQAAFQEKVAALSDEELIILLEIGEAIQQRKIRPFPPYFHENFQYLTRRLVEKQLPIETIIRQLSTSVRQGLQELLATPVFPRKGQRRRGRPYTLAL